MSHPYPPFPSHPHPFIPGLGIYRTILPAVAQVKHLQNSFVSRNWYPQSGVIVASAMSAAFSFLA